MTVYIAERVLTNDCERQDALFRQQWMFKQGGGSLRCMTKQNFMSTMTKLDATTECHLKPKCVQTRKNKTNKKKGTKGGTGHKGDRTGVICLSCFTKRYR